MAPAPHGGGQAATEVEIPLAPPQRSSRFWPMIERETQVAPRSRVRQTAAEASGMNRPRSAPLSGIVQAVSGSRGCAAIGNPKSEGRPSVISSQCSPPSAVR